MYVSLVNIVALKLPPTCYRFVLSSFESKNLRVSIYKEVIEIPKIHKLTLLTLKLGWKLSLSMVEKRKEKKETKKPY